MIFLKFIGHSSIQISSVKTAILGFQSLRSHGGSMVMTLVLWYGSICSYFCIFSIFALMLTYYDAWYQHDASCKLCEPS